MQALQLDQYYTYEDYLKWDEPYELFDGVPYLMAPASTRFHQEVNVELTRQLANFLHGNWYMLSRSTRLNIYNKTLRS